MGLLTLAGVRPPQPGDDTLADRAIRQALELSACAHRTLRNNLQDPGFAGILCRALGCRHAECAVPVASAPHDVLAAVEARTEQLPILIDKLRQAPGRPTV